MMTSAALLQELSECVCAAAAEHGAGPVCECLVLPGGTSPLDYCGGECGADCGSAFVRVTGASPYSTLGAGTPPNQSCSSPLQLEVQVGIIRCLPIPDDGSPLSAVDQAEVAYMLDRDMHAIRYAVSCCFSGDALLLGYTPIPADGGCIGGMWGAILDVG